MDGNGLHVEIAGAGITGLTAACVLAQRGWSVRVHERSSEVREIGAGLYLKENGIAALNEIGAFDRFESIVRLKRGRVIDEKGRVLLYRNQESEQSYIILRQVLHRTLAEMAVEAGAEIVTSSPVAGADPDGTLLLASGERLKADLVLGADGYKSNVRESLGLTKRQRELAEGAIRILVERTDAEAFPEQQEHWSGRYRIGFAPCSDDKVYIFLCAPVDDPAANRVPVNQALWQANFPHLRPLIERMANGTGNYGPFSVVDPVAWHKGRVAILGDAAHAQPPNLGQGAGLSIVNALALGHALDRADSIGQALIDWEADRRPVSDAVKSWSYTYGEITCHWPQFALPLRSAFVWGLGHFKPTARRWGWLWRGGIQAGEGVPLETAAVPASNRS